jgi:hypothetical protein
LEPLPFAAVAPVIGNKSKGIVMIKQATGVAIAALLLSVPALAESGKLDQNKMAPGETTTGAANSGPGVQGPPDTRTGPSTRAPEDGSGSGASTGEAGSDSEHSTTPSQDSSGVQGRPGNKSGPAAREPSDSDAEPMKKEY